MPVETIRWVGGTDGRVELVDQTLLPAEFKYRTCETVQEVWEAIRTLRVRGAPAIGIAAAMGVVLGVRRALPRGVEAMRGELEPVSDYLASSRPTAVNLVWALERMKRTAREHADPAPGAFLQRLLEEALRILEEDRDVCRRIGRHGADLLADGATVLTHCNAGGLATADYGTALGVLFAAHEQGKRLSVYVDETRPLLQGARLTAWELQQAGIPATLICDNMAAHVMQRRGVDAVIVGADRIAANGDAANKIGTYGLSVLAREHGVPFYVAAPISTFDLSLADGSLIPIEERAAEEVTRWGGHVTAPEGIAVYNPAFDVTPARNIAAIITEEGVIRAPDAQGVARVVPAARP
ncbi:MAG: S-methyl-5-thioribose-1-phosphate isomerase [Candidatus Brocadiaceae bacterium]|nr:S-methyl-5-thioribose-1-phosphate isomerase [Candidatus Brocadiaceae bacterium]